MFLISLGILILGLQGAIIFKRFDEILEILLRLERSLKCPSKI